MSVNKIVKTINENCKDDKIMKDLLLDLLEFNLTGRQWYKDEYTRFIEKYAKEMGEKNEDKRNSY